VIGAVLGLVGLVRKAPGESALVAMAAAAALGLTYCWGLSNGKATEITRVASAQLAQAQQANEQLQERVREGERASMSLRDELALRADQVQGCAQVCFDAGLPCPWRCAPVCGCCAAVRRRPRWCRWRPARPCQRS
jgi:hypothetical protein